jgi:hypothetical protein
VYGLGQSGGEAPSSVAMVSVKLAAVTRPESVKPLGGGSWRLEGLALLLPVIIRNFNWCPPTGVSNGRAADRESE